MKTKNMTIWRRRLSAGRKPGRHPSSRAALRKPVRASLPVSALKIPAILLESDPLPEAAMPDPPAAAREPASARGWERADSPPRLESPAVANPLAVPRHPEPDADAPTILTPALEPPPTPRDDPGQLQIPVGAPPPVAAMREETAPQARLWLTPRDPRSLLASWTLPAGTDPGHAGLRLRVLTGGPDGGGTVEQALPADVSHGFVPVGRGDTDYAAQIGYYTDLGQWTALVESVRVRTPADTLAPESSVVITRAVDLEFPLVTSASEEVRAATAGARPPLAPWPAAEVLAGGFAPDSARGGDPAMDSPASHHRGDERGIGSPETAEKNPPVPVGVALDQSVSSPMGGVPRAKAKDYWLVANAELVVYGATEPGSEVTLAGVRIPLRADGSFSCRLALPAGRHELSIRAVSPDGSDSRQVPLEVTRI